MFSSNPIYPHLHEQLFQCISVASITTLPRNNAVIFKLNGWNMRDKSTSAERLAQTPHM